VSTRESILYTHYATVLTLLRLGLSYTEIQDMSEAEINMMLATNASIEELKNETMERQQKMAQANNAHPTLPKGF